MQKVLMVCLGNICRSPLAEGILQSKVNSDEVFVDSAGTAAYHIGKHPDVRSIDVAAKYGLNIKNQRARKFTVKDFDKNLFHLKLIELYVHPYRPLLMKVCNCNYYHPLHKFYQIDQILLQ